MRKYYDCLCHIILSLYSKAGSLGCGCFHWIGRSGLGTHFNRFISMNKTNDWNIPTSPGTVTPRSIWTVLTPTFPVCMWTYPWATYRAPHCLLLCSLFVIHRGWNICYISCNLFFRIRSTFQPKCSRKWALGLERITKLIKFSSESQTKSIFGLKI